MHRWTEQHGEENTMSKAERGALLGAIIAMALGGLWAWAGSQGTREVAGYPLFALAALWAFS